MIRIRDKRRGRHGVRAEKQLAQIDASISELNDEDLLDLADIFGSQDYQVISWNSNLKP